MKKILLYLLVIGFLYPSLLYSQSTTFEVFYYDSEWNRVDEHDDASFTRMMSFKIDDYSQRKPIGWVKDFYTYSGNLQWKGKFSYYDINNSDNNKPKGLITWYYDDVDATKSSQSYYLDGKLEGNNTSWHINGKVHTVSNYTNGIIDDGTVEFYTDKGIIYQSVDWKNGIIEGFIFNFYENGKVKKAILVSNGEINPWHLEFDQWGECKKVFKDHFNSKLNDWTDKTFTDYSCIVDSSNGLYVMKSFSKEGFCWPSVVNIPDLNPFSDFVIETRIKNTSEDSYRILFGYQDWDNYSSLDLIQSEGEAYYKVSREYDGVKRPLIKDWKKIETDFNINNYNTIQLRQFYSEEEEEADFYITLVINGEVIDYFESPFMKGFNFGYSICQEYNNLYVDYFEIRYPFDIDDNSFNRYKSSSCASAGTGFAINSNGYIATNYHVINECENIFVKGINGDTTSVSATVILKDTANDLAILKVDNWLGSLPFAFNTYELEVLEDVFAYGYPMTTSLGERIKATNGTISSLTATSTDDIRYYQHTAPIQPGNSGGPLIDKNGNIVGVNTLGWSSMQNVFASVKIRYLTPHMYDLGISTPDENNLKKLDKSDQFKIIKDYVYKIIVK